MTKEQLIQMVQEGDDCRAIHLLAHHNTIIANILRGGRQGNHDWNELLALMVIMLVEENNQVKDRLTHALNNAVMSINIEKRP